MDAAKRNDIVVRYESVTLLGAGLSSVCISSRAMLSSSCNETIQVINEYILCQVVGGLPHSLCFGASFEVIKRNLAYIISIF